jgi:signal transduction histidine kinase
MSLKAVMTAAVLLLGALSLAAAGSLFALTNYLHQTANGLNAAVEGVRMAEELEVELLTLHRLSPPLRQGLSADPTRVARTQSAIQNRLIEAWRHAHTEQEQALLDEAEHAISAYLLARERSTRLPPEDALRELEPRLEASLASLERFVAFNVEEAHRVQARAKRWDEIANIAGLGTAVLLLMGCATLLIWLRRSTFRPLLDISRAMQRFGSGRKRTRAPEQGPAELREMARTFNDMANSLSRQQEDQLTFLAGVAHDLRNPLSALKMSAALVSSDRPLPEERVRKTMALVRRQVARLDRMVGDLLDATRIEAGRFELHTQPRDVRGLASEVVELYQGTGASHELRLVVPEQPVVVRCDGTRLEQVLHNLVSNALKYSPSGSRVEVHVAQEGGEAVLAVVDRGIGISSEELRHLFAPFRRTRHAREVAPGVGIGLSVARRIVEAHGGRIEVDSRPGSGSTFRVRLPLASTPSAPPPVPVDAIH